MKYLAFLLLVVICIPQISEAQEISNDDLIKAAVLPLPAGLRDAATVMRIGKSADLEVLREGSNEMRCLTHDPESGRFHVACYHESLEPWMARGRDLKGQGLSKPEYDEVREKEITDGTLAFPSAPASLYSLSGDSTAYDYASGTLNGASPLYVVYLPYATEESSGLATSPVGKGAPWIMDSGKPWAHIMVITGEERLVRNDAYRSSLDEGIPDD